MKLSEVIDFSFDEEHGIFVIDDGIFTELYLHVYNEDCPFIPSEQFANHLDMDYFVQRSGDKNTSRMFNKFYDLCHDKFQALVRCLWEIRIKFLTKWESLYNTMVLSSYNALDNFNKTKNSTRKTNTNISNSEESSLNTFGFNTSAVNGVPKEKATVDTTVTGDADDNYIEFEQTDSGRDGKFSAQELLEKEIEVKKKNFYEILFKDVDSVLANRIYDPD